ncbi:hypothetical protein RHGRI_004605 [Rhododendron griersonianum]|uniref:AB hydrolase-1 domain-containing protein n=1 Tax=Rhododendron griersonianum TaxID=479676 RepID=A0AAV6L984_9ERIC|nr:hypothetical protein RHGRI_004605 [Rhododendron griersonianum]
MDQIQRKYVEVNGLKLHVAETGTGPTAVMFLHGFPEIWYSWRHQMIAVANAGYRAIAPDYRGYGLSDPPPEPEKTSHVDFVDDMVALLDALDFPKVFLVGKDFGSPIAYLLVLLYPKRISGVVTLGLPLGVPFRPLRAAAHHKGLPEGFYISRWKIHYRNLDELKLILVALMPKQSYIYILFSKSEIPIAEENEEIMDLVEPSIPLPPWFTDEDMAAYGALYEKSGFQTALQVPYSLKSPSVLILCTTQEDLESETPRNLNRQGQMYSERVGNQSACVGDAVRRSSEVGKPTAVVGDVTRWLTKVRAAWVESMHKHLDIPNSKIEVPSMLIMGEEDYVFKFPGMEDHIRSGEVKADVPSLETIYVPEGTHFVQEQFPDQVFPFVPNLRSPLLRRTVIVLIRSSPVIVAVRSPYRSPFVSDQARSTVGEPLPLPPAGSDGWWIHDCIWIKLKCSRCREMSS